MSDKPRFRVAVGEGAADFTDLLKPERYDGYNLAGFQVSVTGHLVAIFEDEDIVLAREVRKALAIEEGLALAKPIILDIDDNGKQTVRSIIR